MNFFLSTKSMRKLQNKNLCKSSRQFPNSVFSFNNLPNEILCRILSHVLIADLLLLYTIPSLNMMVVNELISRFKKCQLGIRLYFDQEARWRYTLDMKLQLVKYNRNTPRLYFIPMASTRNEMRFYTSKILRRPFLYKVCLISTYDDLSTLPENLLNKSLPLTIKQSNKRLYSSTTTTTTTVALGYGVSETPYQVTKSRPGERWIQPCVFECDLDWLCQTKSTLDKWFDLLPHCKPTRRKMTDLHFTRTEKLPSESPGQVAEIGIYSSYDDQTIPRYKTDTSILIPNLIVR
ncbi:uncharacterized protein BX664DRAFT_334047 [Halteromyces radiatus]|uniref:uncharacterized protein n=1 Tax=Halteromyces radiatus TaxID=101107 RepID=UPI0022204018|nr:uncharacterized protein BX664DRAFT_334047 [Halteromyces radiatus]KAI8089839.1 hypothetical protein BX664DRAFT_334047 [Halteromyces radiatus]